VSGSEAEIRARLVAGRYWLVRELGRGGMGVVWLAEDQLVGRRVAVKELRPPPGMPDAEREVFGRRGLQEARSAARVHHPGAVQLHDVLPVSPGDDAIYLIMELVDGPTLAEMIQRNGRLPDAVVAGYGLQLLSVLEAAHALGVVHRDVKPSNIIIAAGDQAKLTDFGIAHTAGDPRLTRTGVLGTQAYLAPELFESAPITPAADLWSLGATLFHAAQGSGAFERDTTGATLRALLIDQVPVPKCGPGLAAAIGGMLQRDPARRATVGQARAQLQAAAAQPAAETPAPAGVTQAHAVTISPATRFPRQDLRGTSPTAPEHRWDQIPTRLSPSSAASPRDVPQQPGPGRKVASHRHTVASSPPGRRVTASALLGLGVILGLAGLFPRYWTGLTLASQLRELVRPLCYIVVWAAATIGVLRGTTVARSAALLGTGLGAVLFGFFFADLGYVISEHLKIGAGFVLSLLGWLACTAGSACALTVRVTPRSGSPRAGVTPLGLVTVSAAIGTAVTFLPPWTKVTWVQHGISHTITAKGSLAMGGVVAAGNVLVIVALIAIAIVAAVRRPIRDGTVMLAGAIVPMIAGAAYFLILDSVRAYHQASIVLSYRETPDFWIYCPLLMLLITSCACMLVTLLKANGDPSSASGHEGMNVNDGVPLPGSFDSDLRIAHDET
jgi:serine/threonine protein kinase